VRVRGLGAAQPEREGGGVVSPSGRRDLLLFVAVVAVMFLVIGAWVSAG
jgi:hypothetical protein